jgi:hypothetical protein
MPIAVWPEQIPPRGQGGVVLPTQDVIDRAINDYLLANKPPEVWSQGYMEAPYTIYAIQTTYNTDSGLQAAPTSAIAGTSVSVPLLDYRDDKGVVVRVRRPHTIKIVDWIAQRLHVKPVLPHWNNGNDNEKLLDKTISARNPLQSVNQKTWEVCGRYVYAFKIEPFVMVNKCEFFILPAGRSPAESNQVPISTHSYTQADFSFVPLDARWIPIDDAGNTKLPIDYVGRARVPAGPVVPEVVA